MKERLGPHLIKLYTINVLEFRGNVIVSSCLNGRISDCMTNKIFSLYSFLENKFKKPKGPDKSFFKLLLLYPPLSPSNGSILWGLILRYLVIKGILLKIRPGKAEHIRGGETCLIQFIWHFLFVSPKIIPFYNLPSR